MRSMSGYSVLQLPRVRAVGDPRCTAGGSAVGYRRPARHGAGGSASGSRHAWNSDFPGGVVRCHGSFGVPSLIVRSSLFVGVAGGGHEVRQQAGPAATVGVAPGLGLVAVTPELNTLTEEHMTYPVLFFYRTGDRAAAHWPAWAGVTAAARDRPAPSVRRAVAARVAGHVGARRLVTDTPRARGGPLPPGVGVAPCRRADQVIVAEKIHEHGIRAGRDAATDIPNNARRLHA